MTIGTEITASGASEAQAGARLIARMENVPFSRWHTKPRIVMGSATFFDAFDALSLAFALPVLISLWQITPAQIGIFFSFIGVTMALVQGPLLGYLSQKVSDVALVVTGSAILGMAFMIYRSTELPWLFAGGAVFSLGNGLMWPSFLALLSKQAGSRHQGAVQGFSGSTGAIASILGLLAGGAAYRVIGAEVFMVCASLIGVVFLLSLRLSPPADAAS